MNQTIATSPDDPSLADFAENPGRRLRAARQSRGLEIERVATQLHLRRDTVEALEQDHYEVLPAPVFVVGYLRNYARLLGLDPTPLIAAYRANAPTAEIPAARPTSAPPREIGAGHILVRLISLALVAAVIGMLALWWQNRADLYPDVASEVERNWLGGTGPATRAEEPEMAEPPPALPADLSQPAPEALASPEAPASPELALATPPAPVAPELVAPPAPTTPESTLTPMEPTPLTAPPPEPALAQPSAMPDSVSATATPESAATDSVQASPPSEIVLEFTGTSWIEVRNAQRKIVLTGEMRSGDRRVLDGTPPLTFVIGNASSARMTVGGAPYDLIGRSRGNVARFTFDPEGGE